MSDWLKYFILPVACFAAVWCLVIFIWAYIEKSKPKESAYSDANGAISLRRPRGRLRLVLASGVSWLAVFAVFGLYNIFADDRFIGIVHVCGAVAVFAVMLVTFVSLKSQRLEISARTLVFSGIFCRRECALDDVCFYSVRNGNLRLFDKFGIPVLTVSQLWADVDILNGVIEERGFVSADWKCPACVDKRTPQYMAYKMRCTIRNGGNVAWALFAMTVAALIVILVCIPSSAIVTEKITGRVAGYEDYKITLLGDEKPYIINSLARPYLDETFMQAVSEGDEVTLGFYIVLGGRRDIAEIAVDGRVYLNASDVLAAEHAERESMKLGAIIAACIAVAFLTVAVVCTVASKKPRAARAKDGA